MGAKSKLGCNENCNSCSSCRRSSSRNGQELFTSPVHQKSNLGRWTPTMTKETFYNKMCYRPHNRFNQLIGDKDAIIHMLLKRQAMTSPIDSRYAMISQQLEQLQNQVSELKKQKAEMLEDRNALLRYATEHAGNVVPVDAVYHAMSGKIPKMKIENGVLRPVGAPEDTYEDEDGGQKVREYSTGPLGNGADIKQEQEEDEEGSDESPPLEMKEVSKPPVPIKEEESESDAESVRGNQGGRPTRPGLQQEIHSPSEYESSDEEEYPPELIRRIRDWRTPSNSDSSVSVKREPSSASSDTSSMQGHPPSTTRGSATSASKSESERESESRSSGEEYEPSPSPPSEKASPVNINHNVYRRFLSDTGLMNRRLQPSGRGSLATLKEIVRPHQGEFERWLETKNIIQ